MYKDFDTISQYYDLMYVKSDDYSNEVNKIIKIFNTYKKTSGNKLLDIACGTGGHIEYLQNFFHITGIDLSKSMLKIAKEKFPNIPLIEGDMFNFNLSEQFDIILNLYGSIGFAHDYNQLLDGLLCVNKHLKNGGVFILTPWSTTETFQEGLFCENKTKGSIQFSRMESISLSGDGKITVDMHHLIGENNKIKYNHNTMHLSLFSEKQYRQAIETAGLTLLKRLDETEFCMGAFVCTKLQNNS
ncbi:class I SAM-dependent DNA methyltransferase [Clostridium lundense]|uniref:class I SAM-dependent DNA methyltransferase n=1 Tax=Clostridium lundense TaxID=319475 RepID=UPI000483A4B7|nr:class I SAM-dependent methyltransferase [Clostridium lundense]